VIFPFSALVGQDAMKLALLLAAVNPAVGGVLVMGDRGTAKSTAVRALARVLPPVAAVEGCPFQCEAPCEHAPGAPLAEAPAHVVDVPLSADIDRLCGALDLEAALSKGVRAFQPGLVAMGHRGFLYIDEVNLLQDHLVDALLDVAASGENIVEREGLSVRHAARFVLVGSGNPEEGELRPQLLDRFGLYARIRTVTDLGQRVAILKRRHAFSQDPEGFLARWAPAEARLRARLARARALLPAVRAPGPMLVKAAELCLRLGLDGHRGELTLVRAASAHAALAGRKRVMAADLSAVAPLALAHRLRRDPLEESDGGEAVAEALGRVLAIG
jgi:magnesium chelatase subunit I